MLKSDLYLYFDTLRYVVFPLKQNFLKHIILDYSLPMNHRSFALFYFITFATNGMCTNVVSVYWKHIHVIAMILSNTKAD